MLGKLIKNEFVQRYKTVCGIYLMVLAASIVENIARLVYDNTESDVIDNLYRIITVSFMLVFIGSAVMVVLLSFLDYNKRLFKDQGYLTHTLPVKPSTMLFARVVCDLAICLSVVVVYPFCFSIAIRNFDMLKDVFDIFNELFLQLSDSEMLETFISAMVMLFFILLFSIWLYYFAYAAGHSFKKNKKVMSVLIYIAIYAISEVILSLVSTWVEKLVNVQDLTAVIIHAVVFAIYTVLCFIGTATVCKNHLNLE